MVTPFERLFGVMTKPWVVVGYLVLIILSILYFDKPIAYYFHDLDLKKTRPVLGWVTNLGLGGLYLVPLFILALFFRYVYHNKKWEERAWFLWLCVLISSLVCLVLKISFGRSRPDLLFSEHLYGFFGLKMSAYFWSFPSGHTTTIMSMAFGLSVLFPRYWYAFILVGLMIVCSRVMLTHHYLSDVMIAGYLALVEVGLIHYWLHRKNLSLNLTNCDTNRT